MAENYIDKIEVDGVERPIRDTSGSVRYDEAQSLTDAQKTQARGNINAAPGGFGWGGNAVSPPNKSLDDAKETGLYLCGPNYIGAPSGQEYIGYGTVLSIKRSDDSVIQVYWTDTTSLIAGTPLNLVRKFDGTKWYPWEWVNPPMELGTEYRTTERYLGKPVYVKAFNISSLPNNNSLSVNIGTNSDGSADETIRAIAGYGVTSNGNAIPAFAWSRDPSKKIYLQLYVWIAYLETTFDASSEGATIVVKYTKTTD